MIGRVLKTGTWMPTVLTNVKTLVVGQGNFFCICPPPELLPVLGPLERYRTPTLDTALLCSSRAGSDLGQRSDRFEELCQLGVVSQLTRPYNTHL